LKSNDIQIIGKERISFIDKACGIAIVLVVYGHITFPEALDIPWYLTSNKFIYKFHMPLFMCLSGFIAFLSVSKSNIKSKAAYLNFEKKKAAKFLPGYIFFSLLAILVDVFYHHAKAAEINNSIYSFFFTPSIGSAAFVWYIYVLFGFYLITPFLLNLKSSSQFLLLAFGFILTNTTISPLFSADLFCKYFFFFFSGGLIYKNIDTVILFLERNGKWIVLLTFILIILDFFTHFIIPYQLLCIGIIPSVLYISNLKWPKTTSSTFVTMGVSAFAIYLLHTSVLNAYYIFFKLILGSKIGAFFIFSCLILSIAIPISIRLIFNRVLPHKIYTL